MSSPNFNIYGISDNHFLHGNIISHCSRPFGSVQEMDTKMIAYWNNVVRKTDMVINLGDIVFTAGQSSKIKDILNRLNGRKILVMGNHDRKGHVWYLTNGFDFVCDRFSWEYNGKKILFIHNPNHVMPYELRRFDYILHGHIHNNNNCHFITKKGNATFINMSVEQINYRPMSLMTLLNRLSQGYYEKEK